MKAKIENNVVTFVTEIPMESVIRGYSDMTIKNDQGNILYVVKKSNTTSGSIGEVGLSVNAVVDGMAAVTIIEDMDMSVEEIKRKYARGIKAAKTYCPIIAADIAEDEQAVEDAFDEVTTTTGTDM